MTNSKTDFKYKLTTAGLLLILLISVTGCIDGRPPEYSVSNPVAIPDGSGGAYIAYQVNDGKQANTFIQRLGADGEPLWLDGGKELASNPGGFGDNPGDFTALVTDSRNQVTIAYSSDKNIWASMLEPAGNPVWDTRRVTPTDVSTPVYFKATGNGSGEIIIAWVSGNNSLTLLKSGGQKSYFTTISTPDIDRFDITCDKGGNVFVIWKDNPSYTIGNMFIQKIDDKAHALWTSEHGKRQLPGTCLFSIEGQHGPAYVEGNFDGQVISDDEGGAIVTYVQGIFSEDGRKIVGHNLYTQHITGAGELLWTEDAVLIAEMAYAPRITGDASGNITVLWKDMQNVYAQRLDTTGTIFWQKGGIQIGNAGEPNNIIHYYAAADREGGIVVVWNYSNNGSRTLRAQHLDVLCNKLWGDNGIEVSSVSPYWGSYSTPAQITPDGNGGFFITWAAGEHIKDRTSSYIQRISGEGEALWGEDGIQLGEEKGRE